MFSTSIGEKQTIRQEVGNIRVRSFMHPMAGQHTSRCNEIQHHLQGRHRQRSSRSNALHTHQFPPPNPATVRINSGDAPLQTQNIIDIFKNLNGICKNISGICRNISDILSLFRTATELDVKSGWVWRAEWRGSYGGDGYFELRKRRFHTAQMTTRNCIFVGRLFRFSQIISKFAIRTEVRLCEARRNNE